MTVNEDTARQLFDSLGGPDCKADWDKQPERIKDVFRKKATPNPEGFKIEHHYGANLVWLIRADGTAVIYKSMTGSHRRKRDWEVNKHFRRRHDD